MKTETPFLVFEGMISVRALLENYTSTHNDRKIEKIWYTKKRTKKHPKELAFLRHRSEEYSFLLEEKTEEDLEKYTVGHSHGGILAFTSERTYNELTKDVLSKEKQEFFVMMEGIEDPFNFGYALRSLYAAGVDGVLLSGNPREGADGTVCRSSAGASEKMPIYNMDPEKAVALFREAQYKIVSSDVPNSVSMYDADLKKPLLLIVGGEKRGISAPILKSSDEIIRLDYGRPFTEALSAVSAASILAFEVFRQNRN